MVYGGHVKDGVVVFDQPVVLPEGLTVRIEITEMISTPSSNQGQTQAPAQDLLKYAGKAVGLPEDAARNHDHYLYGTAKR